MISARPEVRAAAGDAAAAGCGDTGSLAGDRAEAGRDVNWDNCAPKKPTAAALATATQGCAPTHRAGPRSMVSAMVIMRVCNCSSSR